MTDYTNFDTILKKSTNVGGLDEIHEHILDLTKQYEALKTNETVREELIVDMKSEIKTLKEENDKFTKMFNAFPNDMDIFSWDEKREMWRHDEDEVSDEEEEFDYGESDDWVWGYGSVQKDNEYVIHISGGGDGVSPNGFEDWVIKKICRGGTDELQYFIRHGGDIPDKLQHGKMIISCPEGNYVSFVPDGAEHRDGEIDFDWLLDDLEEEEVNVKGTITLTSDHLFTKKINFDETITKEQYEDEDFMDNIDDRLNLLADVNTDGYDIEIDFD
jgi:hypothetical protein